MKPIVIDEDDIKMKVVPDPDPDPSYLEQEGFEDRLEEYERGEFGFVGVVAEVGIRVPTAEGGYNTEHTFRSAGLWGIEDDSDEDYLEEVFEEEKAALIDDLKAFNVRVR